ncbi:MAG: zf-HC2 domain-containing protein [Anaerolineae bacterium]|nr:zf-HC2 domain-containing protein [Anaerolineae bacterium]
MFDFLKNFTKSDEEKQQEAFSAYLDNTLSSSQRREFEAQLAEDADLRAEMELARLLRQQMAEMPRRSVPRSFTLDPTVFGAPQKERLVQAYPLLRAATVMTAFFFVIALGLSVFTTQSGGDMASVAQTAMEPAPAALNAPLAEADSAVEEAVVESAAGEKAADAFVAEEEIVVEEEMMQAEPAAAEMPAEAAPLPTIATALTESTELGLADEAATAAGAMEATAEPMTQAEGEPPPAGDAAAVPETLPTATISALPRLNATETAVHRAVEPTTTSPDELANAVDGETAVAETVAYQEPQPATWSLTTSQALLLGLGLLLLILVVVTLLARRKI